MDNEEKQRAKRIAAPYHEESQRNAQKMVEALLSEIKEEPLPNERALTHEDDEMIKLERRLARLLSPINKIETSPATNKTRIPKKKAKKKQKK